jgi:hypothetical protein
MLKGPFSGKGSFFFHSLPFTLPYFNQGPVEYLSCLPILNDYIRQKGKCVNSTGEGGDKMKKITALLLSIFFAIFIMGCATTQDKAKWDEPSGDTMKRQGAEQPWNPGP